MRIIIAGGGIAAIEAALTIRQIDSKSSIDLYTCENVLPYRRILLPKMLGGKIDISRLEIYPRGFYKSNNINIHLARKITAVDHKNQIITLNSQIPVSYDRLLIAVGKKSRKLFIEPILQDKLFTLHDLTDLIKINRALATSNTAIIVGGGVLGLECASFLLRKGCRVHLIEQHNQLLHGILDVASAAFLQKQLLKFEHLTVHTSCSIKETFQHENKAAVLLNDPSNTLIEADIILSAIGLEPAEELGLKLETDKFLQVKNCENIFAAGDCAEICGRTNRYYQSARYQGMTAGKNIAGKKEEYIFQPDEFRCIFNEIPICQAGSTDPDLCESIVNIDEMKLEKLFFINNKLAGYILIGSTYRAGEYYQLISKEYKNQHFSSFQKK